jgi:hypothetical protein
MVGDTTSNAFRCSERLFLAIEQNQIRNHPVVLVRNVGTLVCDNFVTIFRRNQRKSAVVFAMAGGYNL